MNSDNNEPASEIQVYNHKSSIIIKLLISIIIIISIILIVATNPNEINYDTFLKNQAIQTFNGNPIATGLTELFGSSLIDSSTVRSNYVLFSTYKTAINSNQSIVYLGILGHFVPISSNNTSNNSTTSSSNSVANGDNSSTPITPQPTSPNVQAPSTDQSNTYAEPTFKDIMTANTSNKPDFKTSDDGTVMVTGKDGSFMLPVVAIAITYATTEGPELLFPTSPISPINFDIPASQADALAVYYLSNGVTFLGPRGWKVIGAAVSVDGGTGVTLIPSNGNNEWMAINNDGADQGVTSNDIGQWVPEMQTWASQQEPGFTYEPFLYPITFVLLSSHSQGFSYVGDSPNTTNGVVYYNINTAGAFFGQEFITLPDSDHSLETTILNFFSDYTTVKWVPNNS
jgi:hypothetical protein